ncbi:MAG: Asd/ArgC dimerization domain-containing protein [Myxococcota bacterium]|nr:Asd/ArgC dimerization domain-containing protein [Myxococcota bacterium]
MSSGLRLGVVGATGILGQDLLAALEESGLPVVELRAFAGERSLGESVEFAGDRLPVLSGEVDFKGLDAVVLCTPAPVALEMIRQALRVEVPCIDCSGALLGSSEVPLVLADLGAHDGVSAAPLISAPTGPTLVWGPVLSALQRQAGLVRVVGTVLHSASSVGRAGLETLSEQTLALIGQQEIIEPEMANGPVAFASAPHASPEDEGKEGAAPAEVELQASLHRLLGGDVAVVSSSVYVPSFAGQGGTLWVETERPLLPEEAARVLSAAPGIDVVDREDDPHTREVVGLDEVRVGRLRSDLSAAEPDRHLLLWLAGDPVRLAAANAVKLLRKRLSLA